MTLFGDIPRESLAAHVAFEPSRHGIGTQSLKNGRPFSLVWVIRPYVSVPILARRETDRSEATVHGA